MILINQGNKERYDIKVKHFKQVTAELPKT